MKLKTVTVMIGGTLLVIPAAFLGKFIGAGVGTVLGAVCAYTLTDDLYRTVAAKWEDRKLRKLRENLAKELETQATMIYNTRRVEARAKAAH